MTLQHEPSELAQLRSEVVALRAHVDRPRRRRLPRRLVPLALVGLLVAFLPLSILAAGPVFSDLDTAAPVHQPDIQLIDEAGITTGFEDPNNPGQRLYNPKDTVTREEMASFLARTAGLGGNPPVTNAATLGGRPASAFLPADGDTLLRYGFNNAAVTSTAITVTPGSRNTMLYATAAPLSPQLILTLDRPERLAGVALDIAALQVCYSATGGARITNTVLTAEAVGSSNLLYADAVVRPPSAPTCYTVGPVASPTPGGMLALTLGLDFPATGDTLLLESVALTLVPRAAP